MITTIEMLKNRINLLQARDPIADANIIRKLLRRIRQIENKGE